MGAELWHHEAPWNADPTAALRALQANFLAKNYDLTAILPKRLENARNSVAITEEEGDPYEILDIYKEQVELLERLCGEPIPENPEARIEIVRQINADSGQGIGNILDVTDVVAHRDVHKAQKLSPEEILRLVGTIQPTLAEAHQAIDKINQELGRGESVCFEVYDNQKPVGWYFVGNTID